MQLETVSRDVEVFWSTNSKGTAYVQGDPVNFADPRGTNRLMCDTYSLMGTCVGPAVPPGTGGGWVSSYYGSEEGGYLVQEWNPPIGGPVGSGDDGGGGPGPGLSQADVAREVIAAGKLAANALAKNSDCAGLFGLTPGSPTATDILGKLLGADPSVGMVIVNDITSPPGEAISATTVGYNPRDVDIGNGATQRLYGFVQVTINDLAGAFVSGSAQDQAIVLLHELGHVFSDLFGPDSTKITSDGGDLGASQANSALVKSKCFK